MELHVKAFTVKPANDVQLIIDTDNMSENASQAHVDVIKSEAERLEIYYPDGSLYGAYAIQQGRCTDYNKRMSDALEISILEHLGVTV